MITFQLECLAACLNLGCKYPVLRALIAASDRSKVGSVRRQRVVVVGLFFELPVVAVLLVSVSLSIEFQGLL